MASGGATGAPTPAAGGVRLAPTDRYLLAVLGASLAVQTGASLGHQALAPLGPFLQSDLQLSRAAFGLLTTAATLGACLSNVPGGRLCDRLGVRPLFLLGMAGIGTALLLGAALNSYVGLLGMLFLSGLANGLALPPTTRAIVDWFPVRRRALAMGIKQTGVALAGTIVALVAPPLALAHGWQGALVAIGVVAIVAGLGAFLVYRDRPREPHAAGAPRAGLGTLFRNRDLMLLCASTLLLAGVQLSLVNFLVLFLREALGYPIEHAAPFLALAQLSGVAGRVGWGVVSDRLFGGERRPVMRLIAVLAALGAVGLSLVGPTAPGLLVALLVILAGGSAIGWNGVNMTYVAELAGRQQSASAAGLNLTSSGVGILFAPPLFGALVDATGSYPLGFQTLAAAALGSLLLLQLIRPRPSAMPSP